LQGISSPAVLQHAAVVLASAEKGGRETLGGTASAQTVSFAANERARRAREREQEREREQGGEQASERESARESESERTRAPGAKSLPGGRVYRTASRALQRSLHRRSKSIAPLPFASA